MLVFFVDEELEYDPQVYDMYHRAMLEWSCLSFDILPDQLGNVGNHDACSRCIFMLSRFFTESSQFPPHCLCCHWHASTKTRWELFVHNEVEKLDER